MLLKPMVRPPFGAGLPIVTVPVEVEPPMTEVGNNVNPVKVGAVSVRVTPIEDGPKAAVIFAAV